MLDLKTILRTAAAIILALTLTACGGDDNGATDTTAPGITPVATSSNPDIEASAALPTDTPEIVTGTVEVPATQTPEPTQGPTTVRIRETAIGKVLTTQEGFTLYVFNNDEPGSGESLVTGQLAEVWPPHTITGDIVPPRGIEGELALITRDDGARQVTYDGRPLYRYVNDTAPGDTTGDGLGGAWSAARP
jgi:predicted lipoprotein with Yx(FWY)xxD motif